MLYLHGQFIPPFLVQLLTFSQKKFTVLLGYLLDGIFYEIWIANIILIYFDHLLDAIFDIDLNQFMIRLTFAQLKKNITSIEFTH